MMKKVKKLMALVLSLTLVLSLSVFAPVSADESEVALEKLTISKITNSGWRNSSNSASQNSTDVDMTVAHDNQYGTWAQWDKSVCTSGATLNITLSSLSRVKKIEIYVGVAAGSNSGNSVYSKIPVTGFGRENSENWGVATSGILNGTDGTLDTPVTATTTLSSTLTEAPEVIPIYVDSVCDSLSLVLTAIVGESTTTRMGVAEIVVYGEALVDILRDENGTICTVESNKRAGKGYYEENMLDDDSGKATSEISRWRVGRVSESGKPTELIVRLNSVYDISAFRASEYWQSKYQTDTTFDDIDLYVGNTTGATTQWQQVAEGITFNNATVAGSSHNIICGTSDVVYKGDSFKMVINGTDYSDEDETYSGFNLLTNVNLYGVKTDDELAGTTMRKCEISSNDGTTDYSYVATTASLVTLAPTFSGTAPSTVVGAAYNADGKLIGVALGDASSAIVIDIAEGETISYVKILGWESTASLSPVSTTFTRYAVTP